MQPALATQVSGDIKAVGTERRRSERADAAPVQGGEARLTPSSFEGQRNEPFPSGCLDLVQDPSAVTFLCNVLSKVLFRKKEKKNKVVSELSGHPIQTLNTDCSNLIKKENRVQGPCPARLTPCGHTSPAAAW